MIRTLVLIGSTLALTGCAYSDLHLGKGFGEAVGQSTAAQVADPDAKYRGAPAPGSAGSRVALAQERYRTGRVLQPVATATSTAVAVGGGQGGQGGSPGGQPSQ